MLLLKPVLYIEQMKTPSQISDLEQKIMNLLGPGMQLLTVREVWEHMKASNDCTKPTIDEIRAIIKHLLDENKLSQYDDGTLVCESATPEFAEY